MQNLSPIGWAVRPLKRYAEFSGRSSRAEFWWFMLFMMIAGFVMWIALIAFVGFGVFLSANAAEGPRTPLAMFGAFGIVGLLIVLFWLVVLIPTLAVQVRRLHDSNRSGWWLGGYYLLYAVYIALMIGSISSSMSAAMAGSTQPPAVNQPLFMGSGLLGFGLFIYFVVLIVFYCLPGSQGINRFGDDPYGADVEEVFA